MADPRHSLNSMPAGRIFALDAWRASLLLLGLLLHSLSEVVHALPPGGVQSLYVRIIDGIHMFRMPAFFALSGYLGALLYDARGWRAFASNRLKRICGPFAVFMPVLALTLAFLEKLMAFAFASPQSEPLMRALEAKLYANGWWLLELRHLWFLWHLIIIVGVFLILWPIVKRANWLERGLDLWRWIVEHPVRFSLVIGGGAVAYCFFFRWDSLPTDSTWSPRLDLLMLYALAYFAGALTFEAKVRLQCFERSWVLYGVVGLACIGLRYFDSHNGRVMPGSHSGMTFEGYVITQGVGMVMLGASTLGLFWNYLNGRSAFWRYVSDSAYWVYLIHLPFALHLPQLWKAWSLPLEVYGPATLVFTTIVAYASYDLIVRRGWIGILLNGRRYPALISNRLVFGCVSLVMVGGFCFVLGERHDQTLEARNAGGVLRCLPPNLHFSGNFRSSSSALEDGCVPLGDFVACLEIRPIEVSDCSYFDARIPTPEAVQAELESALLRGPAVGYWVAISDRAVEGEWRALDGAQIQDLPWRLHEPNDWGQGEDCAVVGPIGDPGASLNDVDCHHSHALLCQLGERNSKTLKAATSPVFRLVPSDTTLEACSESFRTASDWRSAERNVGAFIELGLSGLEITQGQDDLLFGHFEGSGRGLSVKGSQASESWELNTKSLWSETQCATATTDHGDLKVSCGDAQWTLVRQP